MSSLSINRKHSKRSRQCEDRITNLPCSLITKFLSCLPTKDAVATSVLSKKWKRSWTSVTNLDFDDSIINRDAPGFRKFTSFVTRVLLLRDRSCLQRLSMRCFCGYDDSLVDAWLISALQCNIQELDIFIKIIHPGQLPSDLFLCNTLVVLKLATDGSFANIPISPCLPSLKTLYFDRVQFSDDMSISNLLSGCPVLEELSLCECLSEDVRVVDIIAPVLKRLTICHLRYDIFKYRPTEYQLVMNTPALEYFDFCDCVTKVYVVSSVKHLIKATVNFHYYNVSQFREIYSKVVNDFLQRICHVESLVLSHGSMMVINSCNLVLPKFSNLTYLKLNTGGGLLLEFLQTSPCLETLYVKLGDEDLEKGVIGTFSFHDMPSCYLFHLKEVEIEYFEEVEDDMQFVECILKNAKVLEKLTLHFLDRKNVEGQAKYLKALLTLPKASAICKVMVQ